MASILLLCEYPTLSGGERSILATIPFLQEAGFRITAAVPAVGPLCDALQNLGIDTVPLNEGPIDLRLSQQRRKLLAKTIAAAGPDLIHANSLAMGRLVGPVAANLGIPSISHLRDIIRLSKTAIADLNRNTRLLAVSDAVRCFHTSAGLDAEKTHTLYNGIDLTQFKPRQPTGWLHRELGIPADAPLLAAIGQIALRKGLDVFLKAAQQIASQRPEVHFLVIGSRFSQKDETRHLEDDLHTTAQTSLAGSLHLIGERTDVVRLLSELTLLVHAARQEPLGRVLLEAAASGVAIVATDVGGTAEIFPPGSDTARLVPPDDAAAMARAALELLQNSQLRDRLGQQARCRAEQAFDIRAAAKSLLEHYRQTVLNTSTKR